MSTQSKSQDTVTLTREMFSMASSSDLSDGWTNAQCEVLGVVKEKGWISRLIGTTIPRETWDRFVAAGSIRVTKGNRARQNRLKNQMDFGLPL